MSLGFSQHQSSLYLGECSFDYHPRPHSQVKIVNLKSSYLTPSQTGQPSEANEQ
jgi:hypothetical protein